VPGVTGAVFVGAVTRGAPAAELEAAEEEEEEEEEAPPTTNGLVGAARVGAPTEAGFAGEVTGDVGEDVEAPTKADGRLGALLPGGGGGDSSGGGGGGTSSACFAPTAPKAGFRKLPGLSAIGCK